MSSSPGKLALARRHRSLTDACLSLFLLRYAEIVNVKLGNGQNRKGQVLEIAGRKAVVQVRSPNELPPLIDSAQHEDGANYDFARRVRKMRAFFLPVIDFALAYSYRSSKEPRTSTTRTRTASSRATC